MNDYDELDILLRSEPPALEDGGFTTQTIHGIACAEWFRLAALIAAWCFGLLVACFTVFFVSDWTFVEDAAKPVVSLLSEHDIGKGQWPYALLVPGVGVILAASIFVFAEE
jgi:hypothetical protein